MRASRARSADRARPRAPRRPGRGRAARSGGRGRSAAPGR
ncbi:hypothetical protein APASM_6198 [Actinosynnema pretiosum subsp. pretiosum]|nr:hypothetical protein APASM_6198 [Actinosynnema pretiosum subsp. pretiosum]